MTDIIRQNTCGTCGHKVGHGADTYCRRFPPQLILRLMINPKTKQPEEVVVAQFPRVLPEMWCGEFSSLHRGAGVDQDVRAGQHPAIGNGRS